MAKKKVATKRESSKEIANIAEQIRQEAAGIHESVGSTSGNKIRTTQAKEFAMPDGDKRQHPLRVVILDFNSHNNFYEGAYDPDNIASPVCFMVSKPASQNGRIKNLSPSDNSPQKMDEGVGCDNCPMNQFGTDERGRGKACKNLRRLAVVAEGAGPTDPVMTLDVSPSALTRFDSYAKTLANEGLIPISVVTEIDFDKKASYASLTFKQVAPNGALNDHWPRRVEAQQLITQEPDTSPREQKPAVKKKKVTKKKVQRRKAA